MEKSKRATRKATAAASEDVKPDIMDMVFRGTDNSFCSTRSSQAQTRTLMTERTVGGLVLGAENDLPAFRTNKNSPEELQKQTKKVCIHEININLSKP